MKKNKIKNPSIQSFDKFKKENQNKSLENIENIENFIKVYSSKNKLSINQFKQFLKK